MGSLRRHLATHRTRPLAIVVASFTQRLPRPLLITKSVFVASCSSRPIRIFPPAIPTTASRQLRQGPHPLSNLQARIMHSTVGARAMISTTSSTPTSSCSLTLPRFPVFEALLSHRPDSTAVVHSLSGRQFTYGELPADVCAVRDRLQRAAGVDGADLSGKRVAFLVENSYDYVVTLLAILAARAVAVPLSPSFPASELQYIVRQCQASLLFASAKFFPKAQSVLETGLQSKLTLLQGGKHLGRCTTENPPCTLQDVSPDGPGMMLYTSGTTNRPKGVLLPQAALTTQCRSLVDAWKYSPQDYLLHVLPLHHIHGIVNAVLAPLFAGSTIEFMFPFNADAVWKRFVASFQKGDLPPKKIITFFTAVPTVYSRLLSMGTSLSDEVLASATDAISPSHMRLAISGSAALPTPVKQAWRDLSKGNLLLERYGMTEVGMALSCGLDFNDRVDGSVGWPLPGVEIRLVDVDTNTVIPVGEEVGPDGKERTGEIHIRGPALFSEYWNNPEATSKEFVEGEDDKGRWFKTGDVAVRRAIASAGRSEQSWARGPMYFIQGRMSADIIKTGGEKVSALEVERELLSLSEVSEAAVVAVPSGRWGHKVGAVILLNRDVVKSWSPMDMRRALRGRLVNYKIPQVLKVVDHIPRNAMGKINKKQLVKEVFTEEFSGEEDV